MVLFLRSLIKDSEKAKLNEEFFDEFIKLVEFSDDGVKFKDGAKLPLEKQIEFLTKEGGVSCQNYGHD